MGLVNKGNGWVNLEFLVELECDVYSRMIIGERNRTGDMGVNITLLLSTRNVHFLMCVEAEDL
ncbi:MAG: hypothetical protein ACXU99_01330 [Thermodesulfobacteriota bacterium]